ncbi:Restriction endonuclease type IV Mrr domain-containing protein OS=Streptomyces alboniger OX=132473 GN=CP975_29015 PE=4 SV=1 [Streptomyces alboniger]
MEGRRTAGAVETMTASGVPVRCPDCRREHLYEPPTLPCACGAPVAPPVARGAPLTPVTDRTWADEWITVRCWACGRQGQWPQPELDCDCGCVLRVPVVPALKAPGRPGASRGELPPGAADAADAAGRPPGAGRSVAPAHIPLPRTGPLPRPAFRPVPVRDARDAVTVTALYLRWLGYLDTRSASRALPSGVRITARGMLAQVDPALRRATPRDIECLWLTAMTGASETPLACAFFSLAGYTDTARTRADALEVPLFTLDLTGTPQPVNTAADELVATGA